MRTLCNRFSITTLEKKGTML